MKKLSFYILLIPIFVFLQSNLLFSLPKCIGPESSWDRCYGTTENSDDIYTGEFSNGSPKGMGLRILLPSKTKQAGYFDFNSGGASSFIYLMQFGIDYLWYEDGSIYSTPCEDPDYGCKAEELFPAITKSFNNLSSQNRKNIQRKLKNLNLYEGVIDGNWGRQTLIAAAAFSALILRNSHFDSILTEKMIFHNILKFNGADIYNHGSKLSTCPFDFKITFHNCYGFSYLDDDTFYLGEWKNNNPNGNGKLFNSDGALEFEGLFANGEYGLDNSSNEEKQLAENIHGSTLPACPSDTSKVFSSCYGSSDFEDGASYTGEWQNDKMHGKGTYIFANKEDGKYEGDFLNDEFSGYGILTLGDGSRYEGLFLRDQPNGFGKIYETDGDLSFEGLFVNGEPVVKEEDNQQISENELQDDQIVQAASGSGFYVSKDGYILTNHHVIDGCKEVKILSRGNKLNSNIIAYDQTNDLALLKVDIKPEVFLNISKDSAELTEDIFVAGFPFGDDFSASVKVTKGIVSALTGIGNNYSEIQIDAAIQPGNSGGPILNEFGNVVGIAVAALDKQYVMENYEVLPENINFGVKSSVAINLLNANDVSFGKQSNTQLKRKELGEKIRKSTLYISCEMTIAQIKEMQTKKVMFEKYK
ncbi:MAG: trypsin-like peptidase domain-containing protein [Paracoccaceae bacterium]|nr:trypsin-like peptidase domain-containing protein [Paracoccaceae bacterium]